MVQIFARVMIDRCAQVFQIAPGAAVASAPRPSLHFRQQPQP